MGRPIKFSKDPCSKKSGTASEVRIIQAKERNATESNRDSPGISRLSYSCITHVAEVNNCKTNVECVQS